MSMHTKPLTNIYGRYNMRSQSLNWRFVAKLPANLGEKQIWELVHKDSRAYLVVRLQLLWGEFCKELVVRSAIGGCVTRAGQAVLPAPNVKDVSDIRRITKLKDLSGPSSKWEEPSFAIDQATLLKITNLYDIVSGLGQASAVMDDIKCVRNLIVHPNGRNTNKYTQMTRVLGFRGLAPDQLLSQTVPGSATIFENWLSTLTLAAWNAVA